MKSLRNDVLLRELLQVHRGQLLCWSLPLFQSIWQRPPRLRFLMNETQMQLPVNPQKLTFLSKISEIPFGKINCKSHCGGFFRQHAKVFYLQENKQWS